MQPRRVHAIRRSTTVIFTIVLAARSGWSSDAEPDDARSSVSAQPVTVEKVLAVWSRRAAELRSFRATWVHERTYTKFWAHCHVPSARDEYVTLRFGESVLTIDGDRLRFDSGTVDSSGDALESSDDPQFDVHGRMAHDDARRVFRDDRIRYDSGRPRVDPRDPQTSRWPRNLRAFTTVAAGETRWQFLPAERGELPEAYLFSAPRDAVRDSLHILPLVAGVRPAWLGLSPATCRFEPATQWFQGRECRVLIDDSGLRREFRLDVERDFVPLSLRMDCDVLGARMKTRIDIDYYQATDGRWLPSGWTTLFLDNYGLMEQFAAATVIDAEVNATIAGDEFELAFPAGTWLFDESAGTHAIVTDDGRSVPITDGELRQGLTHAQLSARGTWHGAVGVLKSTIAARIALIALLAAAAAAWTRRRLARAGRPGEPFNA